MEIGKKDMKVMLQAQQGELDAILMYKRLKTSVITAASQCEKFVTYGRNPVHCKKINSQTKDFFTRFNMFSTISTPAAF